MTREPGQLVFPANFERNIAAPLDAAQKVNTLSALTSPDTFRAINDGIDYSYVGMYTVVVGDSEQNNGFYILKQQPTTNIANWIKLQVNSSDQLTTNSKTIVGAINEVKGVADAAAKADASNITVATWKEKLGFITAEEQVQPDWNATSGKGQILNKPNVKDNGIDTTIADARRFGNCVITNETPKFIFLNNSTMRPCQVIAHVSTSDGICDAEYTFSVAEGVIQSPIICEKITNADLSNFNIDMDTTEGKHDVFFQNTSTSTNAIFVSYDIIIKV